MATRLGHEAPPGARHSSGAATGRLSDWGSIGYFPNTAIGSEVGRSNPYSQFSAGHVWYWQKPTQALHSNYRGSMWRLRGSNIDRRTVLRFLRIGNPLTRVDDSRWGGIPLSLGIVGHRDIPDADKACLTQELRDIVTAYRSNHPRTPIVLLTALAEGADQLVVDVSSDIPGATFLAVLPMPVEECRKDFQTPEDQEKFDSYLAAAQGLLIVSDLWPDAQVLGRSFEVPEMRDLAYQRCARFISLFSHVLIAVWDGEEPRLIGGTADTVYHRVPLLEGLTAEDRVEFPSGRPPETTIHVPVSRNSVQLPPRLVSGEVAGGEIVELTGGHAFQTWIPKKGDPLLSALDEMNDSAAVDENAGNHSSVVFQLMNEADAIAGRLQRTFRRVAVSVLTFSVVGLVLMSFVQNVSTAWLLLLAMISFTAVGLLWWRLSNSSTKQRFQQFRVLAEGARVQQVWDEVGLIRPVADVYLTHQPEVRWIRTVLRTAWLVDMSKPPKTSESEPGGQSRAFKVAHEWIGGQVKYFLGNEGRPGALERNHSKALKFLRLGALGASIALLGIAPGVLESVGAWQPEDWISIFGQGLWALGLGLVAASAAYSELMAFRDASRRYVQSIQIFQDGLSRLQRLASMEPAESLEMKTERIRRIRSVVDEVGTEALQETSAWFATSYDRNVRPV